MLRHFLNAIASVWQNLSNPSVSPVPTAVRRSGGVTFPARKVFGADRVGIVGFNDSGFVIAKPTEAHSAWLQTRTRNLHSKVRGSSTNIADGLRKSLELLERAPAGVLRRVWLLTDGFPNKETHLILPLVSELRKARVNVNTIGFGDHFDETLLRRIASETHNGKFVKVKTLRELTNVLIGMRSAGPSRHKSRMEHTVLCLDLSGSMVGHMDGKKKIEVVEEAVLRLLLYKQRCFS